MKKAISLFLALALVAGLLVFPAAAEINGYKVSGEIKASELPDEFPDDILVIDGDTVLTLDVDKTIPLITGDHCLTIRGTGKMTTHGIHLNSKFTLNSGTVSMIWSDDYAIIPPTHCDEIVINGGELRSENAFFVAAENLTVNGGVLRISGGYATLCADYMKVTGGEVYTEATFVGISGYSSWSGMIGPCELEISGGYVEAKATPTREDGWSVGAALGGLKITGGTFVAGGSLAAVLSWDAPITIGGGMTIASPAGANPTAEPVDTEKADYGWTGYGILKADGTHAKTVVISDKAYTVPAPVSAAASAGQITVQWDPLFGAKKYAVYRKVSGGSWKRLTNTVTGTSYTDKSSDLKAGTTYYYTVRAYVNGAWGGYDAAGVSAKAVSSDAPVLTGASASIGKITVKWKAVSGATKYAVYRRAAGESDWTRLTNNVTGTSYADKSKDLKAGTTYYYTVRAYVSGAWGGYDFKGIGAQTAQDPDAPVLGNASANASRGEISLMWQTFDGATKYAVYRRAAGENSWKRLANNVTSTFYTDASSDLKAGTTYYYTVRAYVNGAWSSCDYYGVSVKAALPNIPVLVYAEASPGEISVKWRDVSGATKYAVYRKAAGESGWTRIAANVTDSSYTDKSGLKAGTTYHYTVRAYVNGAWSGYEAEGVSAKAAAASSTVPVLTGATVSAGQITVKWNAVSGAAKYAVYRKASGESGWTRLTNTVTGTSYTDKSVKAGITYYYTVRAYVNGAWGSYDTTGVSAKAK